jgi:thiamine biosynthesis lipoprotein
VDAWQGRPAVRLHDARAALDLGGIAKGYGVDRAVWTLREHGIEHALVNVGGDLAALGASEDGDPWRVGIRSPADPARLVGRIELRDEAVATSGDYECGFRHAGRTYHHLLDPTTAAPRETPVHSVSVVAGTCLDADAAATAGFGLAADAARALFARVAPDARIVSTA